MLVKPSPDEYPEYYKIYIESLPDSGILHFLENQINSIEELFNNLSEEKLLYRYAEGKWSIKEVLAHLLDSEIIMGYRALTFARKDKTNLPMYNHDEYVKSGSFDSINSNVLLKHFYIARESNLLLFNSFQNEAWLEKGFAGSKSFTTRAMPYIIAGHTQHHINVIKEKYLC